MEEGGAEVQASRTDEGDGSGKSGDRKATAVNYHEGLIESSDKGRQVSDGTKWFVAGRGGVAVARLTFQGPGGGRGVQGRHAIERK